MRKWRTCFLAAAIAAAAMIGAVGTAFAAGKDIVVLSTNDVHCEVDGAVGYAGLALYRDEMLQQTPYVALVDAGDSIQGAPIGTLSDGGYLIDIMNKAGYDFAIPGNHEFVYGMDRFLELSGKLDCGYYSCNFVKMPSGEPVFSPYKIMTYEDTQVAFVGVSTPESFTKSTPAYFQDAGGAYIYGFCEDASGEKLYRQVQSAVDAARAEGADYVILVGHLGREGVTDRWSSKSVIANTSGIDALVDGHSHEAYAETFRNKDGGEVPAMQTGAKLNNIGKLTITPEGEIKTELVGEAPVSGTASYTVKRGDSLSRIAKTQLGSYGAWNAIYEANRDKIENPDRLEVGMVLAIPGQSVTPGGRNESVQMRAYLDSVEAQYRETLKAVLGHTSVRLYNTDPETGERAVRSAETNLGDLCADAFRYQLGADIGLMNGGGIRGELKAGDITYNDALTVFPYGNMVSMVRVTGRQLKDALEMSASAYPEENGGFLQVSGLTFTIDASVPSSVRRDDKGNFTGVDGPYRVRGITVAGEALDENKTYTVASHDYMLRLGGDGMSMFEGCEVVKDSVAVDVDVLTGYIAEGLGGTVGQEYGNPGGQGRITIR